jgi:hypothetical protein
VDPTQATVHYRYAWSGGEYPGDHQCQAVVLDAGLHEIGRMPVQISSLTPSLTRPFELGVPVNGEPWDAHLSCDSERLDTPVAYQISDVGVSGPVVRTNGETAVEVHYTTSWPVQLPAYPSTNVCLATLIGPDGSRLGSHRFTGDVPAGPQGPLYFEARHWPDPSLAQRPGQLSADVSCHAFSERDL